MRIILETEHLLFRDHKAEDMDFYCAMEADPEVRRYVGGNARPRSQAEQRFRDIYLPPPPDRIALWATVYKPEDRYIGYCGIYPHFDSEGKPIPGEGVLAFYLARVYWGRGLATEAGRAFLRFGFEELGLHRIIATVQVGHQASVRVLEKLGMSDSGIKQIGQRSYHHYEMTLADWERSDEYSGATAHVQAVKAPAP